jgi:uncharacterized protein YndB with AHSA1/START domain
VIEPLRLSFVLQCDVAHAFDVFTAKTSMWWPHTHSVSQAPGLTVTFEPRVGGRIFERVPDGAEFDWGEVVRWDPPTRLGYLWHIRADRSDATDVEVTFTPLGPDNTRIDIVHSGWERLGDRAQARRDGNDKGWGGLLPHFLAACARSSAQPR